MGSTAVVVVAGVFVGLVAVAAYLRSEREDPGMTTEVALMVAFRSGCSPSRTQRWRRDWAWPWR